VAAQGGKRRDEILKRVRGRELVTKN
jgi:hypothetical protein